MESNDEKVPWAVWEGSVSKGEIVTYCTLREVLLHKEQVVSLHNGLFMAFCPLALGIRGGRRVVLAYLIVGEDATYAEEEDRRIDRQSLSWTGRG